MRLKQGKGDGFTLNVQTWFLFHDKERLFNFEVGVKIVPPQYDKVVWAHYSVTNKHMVSDRC